MRWTWLVAAALGVVSAAEAEEGAAPIEIVVEGGYRPDRVVVKEGEPVVLRFLRKDWGGCTREVVFPTLELRRELPTNEPVLVDLGRPAAGEIPFRCGMDMIHGTVVVEPKEKP